MIRILRSLPMVIALLLLPACGAQKKDAVSALAAAEAAYAAIAAQAVQLAPDQAKAIEATLDAARASLGRAEYQAVITSAQEVQGRIRALAEGLPALLAKLQADWKSLEDSVPGALAETQRKLAGFGQPPQGSPDRARYDAASTQLAQLNEQWDQARSLGAVGKLAEAVAMGEQVRAGMVQVLSSLQGGS